MLAITTALLLLLLFVFWHRNHKKFPIPGAFVVPRVPLIGNTFQLVNNPAKKLMEWSVKYNKSIFVAHLGKTPVLVANSHADVSLLLNRHSTATKSRPVLHTFHNIVSASQGFTVGSTPAGETCQRKKKCISRFLSSKSVTSSHTALIISHTSRAAVAHLLKGCLSSPMFRLRSSDISLLRHAQYFVLSTALMYTYGFKINPYRHRGQLADNVITTENHIIKIRSPIANYQDYLPVLKSFPGLFSSKARYWGHRRDQYMDDFHSRFLAGLQNGQSLAQMSLLGQVSAAEKEGLPCPTPAELRSICLTMVSAGLDNVSLNFDHLMGHLAKPQFGYSMQARLFQQMMDNFNGNLVEAWHSVAQSTSHCPYALALIHEAMRFFTVLPLSLARETTHSFHHNGILIPSKTILLVNSYAANHDATVFPEPYLFVPDRWLDEKGNMNDHLTHFALGAGSRKCSGNFLAIQELYTLLCRMILVFHVRRPTDASFEMALDPFEANATPSATSFEPKEFKVWLKPRFYAGFEKLHREILC